MSNENLDGSIEEVSENEELDDVSISVEDEKKPKQDVKSYHTLIFNIFEDFSKLNLQLKELDEEYNNKRKKIFLEMKKLKRQSVIIRKKLPKMFDSELTKAKKEKRKRKGPNNGGVQKAKDVPSKLITYLDLDKNQKLPRPAVWKLLSQKFKDTGQRHGKDVILNKRTAKFFGKKKNYKIEFTKFSTFLTDIYKEDINNKNVNSNST